MFHQLLHWHHFYDMSTPDVGLVSDGLFHAFGWFAVVIGLVWVADLRRGGALTGRGLLGGILLGAGFFQLYDGTTQHKLLKLHEIRYQVDLVPYDWTWDVLAAVLLVGGALLVHAAAVSARSVARQTRRAGSRADRTSAHAELGGSAGSWKAILDVLAMTYGNGLTSH